MKAVSVIFSIFFLIFSLYSVSAAAFEKVAELKEQLREVKRGIANVEGFSSSDRKSIEKYSDKMVESLEKSLLSSKKVSNSDLKETFEKYQGKISNTVSGMSGSTEIQFQVIEILQAFFEEVKSSVGFDVTEASPGSSDPFINALAQMPEGSLASHYLNLLRTLDDLKRTNLGRENIPIMIDSAVQEFSERFVETFRRDFPVEARDEQIHACLFSGMHSDYNRVIHAIADMIPLDG